MVLTLAAPPVAAQAAPPAVPAPAVTTPDPLKDLPKPDVKKQPAEDEFGAGFGDASKAPARRPKVAGGDPEQKAHERAADLGEKSSVAALATAPPAAPSDADVKRCEDEALPNGWKALDRMTFCGRTDAFHFTVDTSGKRNGFMSMGMTGVGYGRDDGTRSIVLFAKPTHVLSYNTYTPATTFGVEDECADGDDGCSGSGEVRTTMADWSARWAAGTWSRWELSSDESKSERVDFVSYHWFDIKFRFVNGLDDTDEIGFRCGSAPYIPNRPKACVFLDTIPVLQYARFDAIGNPTNQKEVAGTEQGAGHPLWDYSVKYVTGAQNGSTGSLLRVFYENNRILYDIERFYVDIVETGGSGPRAPIVSAGPAAYGDEGDAIPLRGSARSSSGAALAVDWTYAPVSDVDPGTTCTFAGRGTVTPTFTWDDPFPAVGRDCGTVHSFEPAGMCTVTVFVADDDGGTGSTDVMIVVYDPNEGKADINGSTATPGRRAGQRAGRERPDLAAPHRSIPARRVRAGR